MPITLSSASLPIFKTMLGNLAHCLDKASANAALRKFDASVFMTARLAPDMLPFPAQIRIACDAAKLCAARIAGVEAPKFDDNEATFDELKARIAKTLDFLGTIAPEKIDGREEVELTIPVGREKTRVMTCEGYLKHWALPNFFFHVTTAYALLRHNGVDLGKSDYLAGAQVG